MALSGNEGHVPISILDIDQILVPADHVKKDQRTYIKALKGKTSDPVWLSPAANLNFTWLLIKSELIIVTERLGEEIAGASLPFGRFAILSGGFTIYFSGSRIDPYWRSIQEKAVAGDREKLEGLLCEARREFGDHGMRMGVIHDQGLPYGLGVPRDLMHHPDIAAFLQNHPALEGRVSVDRPGYSVFRRKEICVGAALDHLRSVYPDLSGRPVYPIGATALPGVRSFLLPAKDLAVD